MIRPGTGGCRAHLVARVIQNKGPRRAAGLSLEVQAVNKRKERAFVEWLVLIECCRKWSSNYVQSINWPRPNSRRWPSCPGLDGLTQPWAPVRQRAHTKH